MYLKFFLLLQNCNSKENPENTMNRIQNCRISDPKFESLKSYHKSKSILDFKMARKIKSFCFFGKKEFSNSKNDEKN